MTTTLAQRLQALHPDFTIEDWRKIEIRDDSDGRGQYIAKWDHPTEPQPVKAVIDAVRDEDIIVKPFTDVQHLENMIGLPIARIKAALGL